MQTSPKGDRSKPTNRLYRYDGTPPPVRENQGSSEVCGFGEPESSVNGERGREAELAQPVIDTDPGQSGKRRSAFVTSPATRAPVVVGAEQFEKPLGDAFVNVQERTQRGVEPLDGTRCTVTLYQ